MIDPARDDRPALDYAPPRDPRPRPGVAVWFAAACVWLASVPATIACAAGAAVAIASREPAGAIGGFFVGVLCFGAAAAEWQSVVRRSDTAAVAACLVAVPWAFVVGAAGLILAVDFAFDNAARDPAAALAAATVPPLALLVAVTHVRWAATLKRRARGASGSEGRR